MGARGRTVATLVVALVGALVGCSAPVTEPAARPSRYVEVPEISPAARAAYGASAQQAYDELAAFVLEESLVGNLMDPTRDDLSAEELNARVLERFAPGSRAAWEARVDAALAGDAQAQEDVKLLRLYGLQVPDGIVLPSSDPVKSQVVTEAFVDIATTSAETQAATSDTPGGTTAAPGTPLEVTFRHASLITLTGRGGDYDIELDKSLSFGLVPAGTTGDGVSWLIQSYEGELRLRAGSDELSLVDDLATTSAPAP